MSRSGFTQQQASCITNTVLRKIGRAKFDKLYGSSNIPPDVRNAVLDASVTCAPRGAGR